MELQNEIYALSHSMNLIEQIFYIFINLSIRSPQQRPQCERHSAEFIYTPSSRKGG